MDYKFLLVLRFSLINILGIIFLIVTYTQGYIAKAIDADITNVILLIFVLFLLGLIISGIRTFWISKQLNYATEKSKELNSITNHYLRNIKNLDASARSNLASSLRIKLANKINLVKFIANTLVILGLIGTVIGFIIALSGVDGNVSSDPEEISKMITTLIQGMSVALYTTLAGSICSVWLNICYHILSSGANKLLAKIIEIGEVKT
ncbi:MAG: MotA/TolQ/ExbB proton channel family protein [Pseudomonadota bacterium]|nr:MotA/TolQ/ExbB proton channel family protein [Pseudomonadota bacterium]